MKDGANVRAGNFRFPADPVPTTGRGNPWDPCGPPTNKTQSSGLPGSPLRALSGRDRIHVTHRAPSGVDWNLLRYPSLP